jgi:DNA polymerase-3 subunit delta
MANYKDKREEHAFNLITKDIKSGIIKKALFFYGDETYLINWAVDLIVKKFVNSEHKELDYVMIEESNPNVDYIKLVCEIIPMLSEKRVVVLNDFKGINETFVQYISNLPDTCQLIIISNELDKKSKIFKEASKQWDEYNFDRLEESDLKKFIEKRFKASGNIIKNSLISQIINISGYYDKDSKYNLYNLENDLKKISLLSQNVEIESSHIIESITGNVETNVYQMIDAISGNNKDEAFEMLHNILQNGENIYYILAVLIGQFETILEVKELRENGNDLSQMQKALGIHEFRVKKAMSSSEKFSRNSLKEILITLYEVDRNIKNGFLEGSLALEMIIARI